MRLKNFTIALLKLKLVVLFFSIAALVPVSGTGIIFPGEIDPESPQSRFLKHHMEIHQSEPVFGLTDAAVINDLRQKAIEDKDPALEGVDLTHAAAYLLSHALPLFLEGSTIANNIYTAINSLLTLRSLQLRAANEDERRINLDATAQIALSFYTGERRQLTVDFWRDYFARLHGDLAHNARINATINTRAVAAAWSVATVYGTPDDFEAIRNTSSMTLRMFNNFMAEVNAAAAHTMARYYAIKVAAPIKRRWHLTVEDTTTQNLDSALRAAESGDAKAQYNVAIIKFEEHKECFNWTQKAALGGNPEAQSHLATMLHCGVGTEKDEKQASVWLHRAAIGGDSQAQFVVAEKLTTGTHTKQDDNQAFVWYLRSAAGNDSNAQFAIAQFFEKRNPRQDKWKAIGWYRKAAEQDLLLSQVKLARIFANGIPGIVEKDIKQASVWAQRAIFYHQLTLQNDYARDWQMLEEIVQLSSQV